ncbi:GIY-YIG catalytic domain protein [Marinobacter litoralis]|uniref:GIY-YIG catalytic domain protein n=2 Tax=Marinobacter litoralis TaxID=187981 RepID=A0A3M2RC61_9GAMM|nr:GIY-YIG catalytic domain protein [Marinobacter litoralis]
MVEVQRYPFSKDAISELRNNAFAADSWPLVYVLSDEKHRRAYIGETTDTLTRMSTHLKHNEKQLLTAVHLITSEYFNKSATLDVESLLIKYMAADGKYTLLNGNLGLADHNYYQRDALYNEVFREVWNRLIAKGVVSRTLDHLDNSDVFKYSPYKSLSFDQRQGLLTILHELLNPGVKNIVIEGGAGTGKSVLAIFLFKLLLSEKNHIDLRDFSEDEAEIQSLLTKFQATTPKPKMALVVPMTSFRTTLKKAFRHVSGLSPGMVISPSELAKQHYDIVLVDESHRLRKRKNLGAYFGGFDKTCAALGLDKHSCSEVDWVCQQSDKAIFFYDQGQSIKPSDADTEVFLHLKAAKDSVTHSLLSQFRVKAGQPYVEFVDNLLNGRVGKKEVFRAKNYEFEVFESLGDMVQAINDKETQVGLSRLIAGYSWPWISKKDSTAYDIVIDDVQLRWNSTNTDWINKVSSHNEVGCIHTTQGYDLNYAGIIFGEEIRFDTESQSIVIDKANYFDRTGGQGIKDPEELKQYIINIYRTIMLRGIRGTFVYACDKALREYLKQHIPEHAPNQGDNWTPEVVDLKPYVNAVPLFDLQAAAGTFSDLQNAQDKDWVAVPNDIQVREGMFACQVIGESMNRVIPNGALCLFRPDRGGSRNGKTVLVECTDSIDADFGSRYTVKVYESFKTEDEHGWLHKRIQLKPNSYDQNFETLELNEENALQYRVVGEFVCVIE